jgi:signal transduction histidine kinase
MDVFPQSDAAALLVFRSAPERLVVQSSLGYDEEATSRLRLRRGEWIAGCCMERGEPVLYAGAKEIEAALAGVESETRKLILQMRLPDRPPGSAMCVPLRGAEGVFGVGVLESWSEGRFSADDLDLAAVLVGALATCADHLKLARDAKRTLQVMQEATRLESDIMSALSHDMRTPLASIKGYASALLLDEVEWDPETAREYLEIIVQESEHLGEIIADLLETSMIDAGRLEVQREPVILPRLARSVVDEMVRRTDQHHFVLSFAKDFPIVDADAGRIRRVLFNLLDNAVKYSPDGGLVVIRGAVNGREVIISVSDQGEGIAPEHLNRLFERFFRVQFVNGRHVVGTGLGLPIAHKIVELHGGRIWAESRVGEGTTLFFTLPLEGTSTGVRGAQD